MTTEKLTVSRLEETGPRQGMAHVVACAFCRRRLSDEYYFTCRMCDASYCYIHMSRHQRAPCARQTERRRRGQAHGEGVHLGARGQLHLAGPVPGRSPSANV